MKLKKMVLLLALFVVSFGMIACGSDDEPEAVVEPGLYPIGNDELYQILNNESEEENETGIFVYMGRPTCPMCREFEPVLDEALAYLGMSLNYFQTDQARVDDEAQMLLLLETLGITGIPIIVYIENGELRDFLMGMHEMEDVIDFFESNGDVGLDRED